MRAGVYSELDSGNPTTSAATIVTTTVSKKLNTIDMTHNKISLNPSKTLIITCLLIILFSWSIFILIQNLQLQKQIEQQNSLIRTQAHVIQQKNNQTSPEEVIKQKEINFFVNEVLPNYPNLIDTAKEQILDVFVFSTQNKTSGRLVEAGNPENKSYYLISDQVQTRLRDVMISNLGENTVCSNSKFMTFGNDAGLVRNLKDDNGYIIIAGEHCQTYSGENSIAVYSLSTGNKINLTGRFTVPGTRWSGTTNNGTATGMLVGVYGDFDPILVVSYGSQSGAMDSDINLLAFFDLQTGKLMSTQKFD